MASRRHTFRKPLNQGLHQSGERLAREREPRLQQREVNCREMPPRRPQRNRRATASCLDEGHCASIRGLAEAVSVNQDARADPIRGSLIVGYNF